MTVLKFWIFQVLVALDQFFTALVGGFADETLSSYAYRMEKQHKPWGFMRKVFDGIFFWQTSHCLSSYEAERARRQLPPELR